MRLEKWVEKQGEGELSRISRVTGLAYSTVHAAKKGITKTTYETARKISEATHGAVSIDDLCRKQDSAPQINHSALAIASNGKAIVRRGGSRNRRRKASSAVAAQ